MRTRYQTDGNIRRRLQPVYVRRWIQFVRAGTISAYPANMYWQPAFADGSLLHCDDQRTDVVVEHRRFYDDNRPR